MVTRQNQPSSRGDAASIEPGWGLEIPVAREPGGVREQPGGQNRGRGDEPPPTRRSAETRDIPRMNSPRFIAPSQAIQVGQSSGRLFGPDLELRTRAKGADIEFEEEVHRPQKDRHWICPGSSKGHSHWCKRADLHENDHDPSLHRSQVTTPLDCVGLRIPVRAQLNIQTVRKNIDRCSTIHQTVSTNPAVPTLCCPLNRINGPVPFP